MWSMCDMLVYGLGHDSDFRHDWLLSRVKCLTELCKKFFISFNDPVISDRSNSVNMLGNIVIS